MTRLIFLAAAAVVAGLAGAGTAKASINTTVVPDCSKKATSIPNTDLEQNQIFILQSQGCSGRFTVYVTLEVDAQHENSGENEASVSIHPIYERQGENVIRTGRDSCEGRPGALASRFNHTTVRCSLSRPMSPGQSTELLVHFFTQDTKNQKMRTWWEYEPGLVVQ